eukprot:7974902-Alexandrium_andersonii.AAC.1
MCREDTDPRAPLGGCRHAGRRIDLAHGGPDLPWGRPGGEQCPRQVRRLWARALSLSASMGAPQDALEIAHLL